VVTLNGHIEDTEVYVLHTEYISLFCVAVGTNCYVSAEDFGAV
jgi:hypothetical protein